MKLPNPEDDNLLLLAVDLLVATGLAAGCALLVAILVHSCGG